MQSLNRELVLSLEELLVASRFRVNAIEFGWKFSLICMQGMTRRSGAVVEEFAALTSYHLFSTVRDNVLEPFEVFTGDLVWCNGDVAELLRKHLRLEAIEDVRLCEDIVLVKDC